MEWAWSPHDTLRNERCPRLPKRLWQLVEKHRTSCHDLKTTSNLKLSKKLKRGVHFEHFLGILILWLSLILQILLIQLSWLLPEFFMFCSQDRSKTTLHSSHSSASTVRHNKPTKGYHPVWISSWNISEKQYSEFQLTMMIFWSYPVLSTWDHQDEHIQRMLHKWYW